MPRASAEMDVYVAQYLDAFYLDNRLLPPAELAVLDHTHTVGPKIFNAPKKRLIPRIERSDSGQEALRKYTSMRQCHTSCRSHVRRDRPGLLTTQSNMPSVSLIAVEILFQAGTNPYFLCEVTTMFKWLRTNTMPAKLKKPR